jgi:hypothetical protein
MGIMILAMIAALAACGAFFFRLARDSQQHPGHVRGVRGYDAAQSGALWGSGAGWGIDGEGGGGGSGRGFDRGRSGDGGGSC